MPSLPAKRKILLIQAKALEKQKLNPSRSARFHMKTRVSLIFCEWLYVMLFSFLSRSSKLCDLKLLCFTTEIINGEDNIKLKPRFNRVIDCCLFIVLKKSYVIIFSWNGFLESFGKYCEQLAEAGNSDLLSSLGSILTKWNSPNTPHQFEILCNLKFSFKARHHFVKENCWHITSSLNWFVTFQKFTLCYRNYWGGILHEMKTLVKQGWNIILNYFLMLFF